MKYKCNNCWYVSAIKLWKCPNCWKFGTFVAFWDEEEKTKKKKIRIDKDKWKEIIERKKEIISKLKSDFSNKNKYYYDIQSKELKRILVNWIKKAWIYLLWWEPWIWKSTLLLKLINELITKNKNIKIIYFSWEELEEQIIERLIRLYPDLINYIWKNIFIIYEEKIENILNIIDEEKPNIVMLDSIQTVYSENVDWIAWWVAQIKYISEKLTFYLKKNEITWFIIWHITKGWEIAWPKYLEHIVDVVLQFEWDKYWNYRFLRAKKNRFWPSDEVGIFEMTNKWLIETENYQNFLIENSDWILWIWLDQSRPILVPIETLITPQQYSFPKRDVIWFNYKRLDLIISILINYLKLPLKDKDIFINIPWEISFNDKWLDLAIAASIIYSILWKKYNKDIIFIWELNLSWKILKTTLHEKRIKEALNLWYKNEQIVDYSKIKNIKELKNIIS